MFVIQSYQNGLNMLSIDLLKILSTDSDPTSSLAANQADQPTSQLSNSCLCCCSSPASLLLLLPLLLYQLFYFSDIFCQTLLFQSRNYRSSTAQCCVCLCHCPIVFLHQKVHHNCRWSTRTRSAVHQRVSAIWQWAIDESERSLKLVESVSWHVDAKEAQWFVLFIQNGMIGFRAVDHCTQTRRQRCVRCGSPVAQIQLGSSLIMLKHNIVWRFWSHPWPFFFYKIATNIANKHPEMTTSWVAEFSTGWGFVVASLVLLVESSVVEAAEEDVFATVDDDAFVVALVVGALVVVVVHGSQCGVV
jgi:hypothetical protein